MDTSRNDTSTTAGLEPELEKACGSLSLGRISHASRDGAKTVAVVGIPYDSGNPLRPGARLAPQTLRRCSERACSGSSSSYLSLEGCQRAIAEDLGDVRFRPGNSFAELSEVVARVYRDVVRNRAIPVFIGGDHSISLATISACQSANRFSVLWLDAHNDTGEVSENCGPNHANVARHILELPNVVQILQVGTRGFRTEQSILVPDGKFRALSVAALRRSSNKWFFEEFSRGNRWYISIDVDVLDPSIAPGTSTPVASGLAVDEIDGLLDILAESAETIGVDVVELNPEADVNDITSLEVLGILGRNIQKLTK